MRVYGVCVSLNIQYSIAPDYAFCRQPNTKDNDNGKNEDDVAEHFSLGAKLQSLTHPIAKHNFLSSVN